MNITKKSYEETVDLLIGASPKSNVKAKPVIEWVKQNFGLTAGVSLVTGAAIVNRITEQFPKKHPVVIFVCKDDVNVDNLISSINDNMYMELEVLLLMSASKPYIYYRLFTRSKNELSTWMEEVLGISAERINFTNNKIKKSLSEYLEKEGSNITKSKSTMRENQPQQIIYYGAPGTGKSHTIKEATDTQPKENVFRTTFHPDSDYSTFVGCYKPTMKTKRFEKKFSETDLMAKLKEIKESGTTYPCHKFAAKYWESLKDLDATSIKRILTACEFTDSMNVEISKGIAIGQEISNTSCDDKIVYSFVPQTFTKAYIRVWQTEEPVYLIIEEINRGNCAQIFGDLFQLLDRGNDDCSEYPIKADNDLALYLAEQFSNNSREDIPENVKSGDELVLPSNLYIWATMNTSDQSLFPIDSAFKRRWDWKYVPISNAGKNWRIEVNDKQYDWWDFLQKINEKIGEATNSEDKKLGYFFCKATNDIINAETFVGKVIFYIWNDVFKDFAEEAGNLFKDISFNKFYTVDEIGNAIVNEEKVALFLQNLGINALNNEEENDNVEDEASNGTKSNHKHLNSVVFPDGTKFSEENITHFDIYLESLKKIGLDTVCPLIAEMKYQRKGCPMVSTEKQSDILESNTYEYHQEGKYYIVKGAHDDTLINILEELKAQLNLDIEINFE